MTLFPTVLFTASGGDPGTFLTSARNIGLPIRRFEKRTGHFAGRFPPSAIGMPPGWHEKAGCGFGQRDGQGFSTGFFSTAGDWVCWSALCSFS